MQPDSRLQIWDLWYPQAGATGVSFARGRQIKAVCTIEGLDRPTETVTLKGPLGQYASVRTADPANLPHLRIGDTVLVTYTEALAVSLEELEGIPSQAE